MTGRHRQYITDSEGNVKYATLEVLVQILTTERLVDATLVQPFVVTADLHTPPQRLLEVLAARYNTPEPPGLGAAEAEEFRRVQASVRLRVFVFLRTWINTLVGRSTPTDLVEQLTAFVEQMGATLPGPSAQLLKLLQRKVRGEEGRVDYVFSAAAPPPLVPVAVALGAAAPMAGVLDVHAQELARQLTLLEQELFRRIRPWELQNLAFAKKDKARAPHVAAVTARFNAVSRWVTATLVAPRALARRVRLFEYFIDVADHCERLQNYNAVNEITCALNASPAYRLRRTWAALSRRHRAKFAELAALTDSARNHQSLRHRIHNVHPPCVPFLGIYLTDLTFIEEGNPTMLGDLINWHKCRLQASIIMEVQTYQQAPYCLVAVPWVQDYLLRLPPAPDDEQLYQMSLLAEPKARAPSSAEAPPSSTAPSPAPPLPPEVSQVGAEGTKNAAGTATTTGKTGAATTAGDVATASPLSSSISGSTSAASASTNESPEDPEDTVTISVLAPGCAEEVEVTVAKTATVGELKARVLGAAVAQRLVPAPRGAVRDYALVAPTTRTFPGGAMADTLEAAQLGLFTERGAELFALYRALQIVDVLWPDAGSAYAVQVVVDPASPLYSAIRVIDNIYRRGEQFVLLMLTTARTFVWLDPNVPLARQGFEVGCRFVVEPLLRRLLQPESDDAARARPARLERTPQCRCALLTKYPLKSVQRHGVAPPSSPFSSGASSGSSSSGSSSESSGSSKEVSLGGGNNDINATSSSSSSTITSSKTTATTTTKTATNTPTTPSQTDAPQSLSRKSSLTASGITEKEALAPSKSTLTFAAWGLTDRRWFVLQDHLLVYYNEPTSPAARYYWPLDYCAVSLVTLTNGLLGVLVRPHARYPFAKFRPKACVFAAPTERATREWHAALRARTRHRAATALFGVPLETVALRPGAASVVPDLVRLAAARVYAHALAQPALFTAPVPTPVLERIRDLADAGLVHLDTTTAVLSGAPGAQGGSTTNADAEAEEAEDTYTETDVEIDTALAQLALSWLGELPEPLFSAAAVDACVAYSRKPDRDALKEVVASLGPARAAVVRYFLVLLTMWGSESGLADTVPALLAPLVARCDNPAAAHLTLTVVARVLADLQRDAADLAIPSDVEALRILREQHCGTSDRASGGADSAASSETGESNTDDDFYDPDSGGDLSVPVTCFSAETTRDLVQCLASAKGIDNLSPLGSPRTGAVLGEADGATSTPRVDGRHGRHDLFRRHNTPAAASSSGGISGLARSLRRRMRGLEPTRPPRDDDGASVPSDSEFDVEIVSVDSPHASPLPERRSSRSVLSSSGPTP